MSYTATYLLEVAAIASKLTDVTSDIERCVGLLADTRRRGGRVFVLGNGGSAANASHFVNDLRKVGHIEAYAPTDNVAELSARANDDGWPRSFSGWLEQSHLDQDDLVFVLSVGGGSSKTSQNLICALDYAASMGARCIGIVGTEHGYLQRVSDAHIVVPTVEESHITPHAESFQSVLCHLLVWHPLLSA